MSSRNFARCSLFDVHNMSTPKRLPAVESQRARRMQRHGNSVTKPFSNFSSPRRIQRRQAQLKKKKRRSSGAIKKAKTFRSPGFRPLPLRSIPDATTHTRKDPNRKPESIIVEQKSKRHSSAQTFANKSYGNRPKGSDTNQGKSYRATTTPHVSPEKSIKSVKRIFSKPTKSKSGAEVTYGGWLRKTSSNRTRSANKINSQEQVGKMSAAKRRRFRRSPRKQIEQAKRSSRKDVVDLCSSDGDSASSTGAVDTVLPASKDSPSKRRKFGTTLVYTGTVTIREKRRKNAELKLSSVERRFNFYVPDKLNVSRILAASLCYDRVSEFVFDDEAFAIGFICETSVDNPLIQTTDRMDNCSEGNQFKQECNLGHATENPFHSKGETDHDERTESHSKAEDEKNKHNTTDHERGFCDNEHPGTKDDTISSVSFAFSGRQSSHYYDAVSALKECAPHCVCTSLSPKMQTRRRSKRLRLSGTAASRSNLENKQNRVQNTKVACIYSPKQGRGKLTLLYCDLERLDEGQYFNDSLVDFYISHCYNEHCHIKERVHAFGTFFFSNLNRKSTSFAKGAKKYDEAYQRVHKWTENVDIFDKDAVLFPINQHFHWSLAVAVNLRSLIGKSKGRAYLILMDSLNCHGVGNILINIRHYLLREFQRRYKNMEDVDFSARSLKGFRVPVPQQNNSCDCGVYVCKFSAMIMRGEIDLKYFSRSDDILDKSEIKDNVFGTKMFKRDTIPALRLSMRKTISSLIRKAKDNS